MACSSYQVQKTKHTGEGKNLKRLRKIIDESGDDYSSKLSKNEESNLEKVHDLNYESSDTLTIMGDEILQNSKRTKNNDFDQKDDILDISSDTSSNVPNFGISESNPKRHSSNMIDFIDLTVEQLSFSDIVLKENKKLNVIRKKEIQSKCRTPSIKSIPSSSIKEEIKVPRNPRKVDSSKYYLVPKSIFSVINKQVATFEVIKDRIFDHIFTHKDCKFIASTGIAKISYSPLYDFFKTRYLEVNEIKEILRRKLLEAPANMIKP